MQAPAHCHTCHFMQLQLARIAGKPTTLLHCRQGVPENLRGGCELHLLRPTKPAPDRFVDRTATVEKDRP